MKTITFHLPGPIADLMRSVHNRYDGAHDAVINVRHADKAGDGHDITITLDPLRQPVQVVKDFKGVADLGGWLAERGIQAETTEH